MENEKNKAFLGPVYCILAALIWGLSFVAQSVGKSVGVFTFNAVRMALGFLVLLPVAAIAERRRKRESQTPFPWKTVLLGGLCCGVPLCIGTALQQYAFRFLEVGKVGFITALYMILVPVFHLFFGHRAKWNIWAGVLLGAIGLYFISIRPGSFSVGRGELVTVIGAVAFAIHILVVDHFCRRVDGIALSCTQFFFAGLLSLPAMLIADGWPAAAVLTGAALPLLYTGIMSSGVAFTAQVLGQKYTEPAVASLLLCLESAFALLFGWVILHETLTPRELLGCGIMFIAVLCTQIPPDAFKKRQPERKE